MARHLYKPKPLGLAGLLAVAALVVVASVGASSASAGLLWSIKGKVLAEGVTKKVTVKVKPGTKVILEAEVSKSKETIECENLTAPEGTIYNKSSWAHNSNQLSASACKGTGLAGLCKIKEPIRFPPKTVGEGDIVQNVGLTGAFEDLLPEESGTKKVFTEVVTEGFGCPTVVVETKLPLGREGASNEGEGGMLAEILEPGVEKVAHVMRAVCPAEPKKAINAIGKEIRVNEYETAEKEKACIKGEAEVEIEKEAWSLK